MKSYGLNQRKSPVITLRIVIALGFLLLSGCSTLSYYAQAAGGQWDLIRGRQPISTLLNDPDTTPLLHQRLNRIDAIRAFAAESLALPVGQTYSGYIELQRDYVVWNVLAAPVDSLELKTWCYPVVGCQSYRGYFAESQARQLADQLADDGWDSWAPGVTAFSTLGWFDDPILSTFAHWPEDQLAGLLFHELSHKELYIDGDSTFNESYATAVELEGLQRYLSAQGEAGQFAGALARARMRQEFTTMVMATASKLRTLYAQPGLDRPSRLTGKAQLLSQLRTEYQARREKWPYPEAYDPFFDDGLNNARIASVGTYHHWVPAFRQLLQDQDGDFRRFHQAVRELSELSPARRQIRLQALALRFPGPNPIPDSPDSPEIAASGDVDGS